MQIARYLDWLSGQVMVKGVKGAEGEAPFTVASVLVPVYGVPGVGGGTKAMRSTVGVLSFTVV